MLGNFPRFEVREVGAVERSCGGNACWGLFEGWMPFWGRGRLALDEGWKPSFPGWGLEALTFLAGSNYVAYFIETYYITDI